MAKAPVVGGFNTLYDAQSACERTINIMPEKANGKSTWRLRTTPGLRKVLDLGEGPARGSWEANDRVFVVSGSGLFEIYSDYTFVRVGDVTYRTTPVSMDDNGVQLGIVDGFDKWVFDLTDNTFTIINDPASYPSKSITVIDGYALFARDGTQQYYYSDLYDMTSYDGLDFASAETNPDRLQWIISTNTGALMLGTKSLELYWNSGDANQVFQRRSGSQLRYGCSAPYSVCQVDNGVIWVGRDENGEGSVYRLSGALPTKISNLAVDEFLLASTDLAETTAFAYQQAGHAFYVMNVPGSNTTLLYDLATGFWHERRSFGDNSFWGRWQADVHVLAFGKNLVGDYQTGEMYLLDLKYFYDDDKIIRRSRTLTPIYDDDNGDYIDFASFGIDCEVGVGQINAPNDNPSIILQCSDNGGKTFGFERVKPIGKLGEYEQVVEWRRLGTSTNRVFQIVYAYPTPFAINNAYISVSR